MSEIIFQNIDLENMDIWIDTEADSGGLYFPTTDILLEDQFLDSSSDNIEIRLG